MFLIIAAVAIVAIIAVAVPPLLRARATANEASTISALRTIVGANTDYNNNAIPHTYASSLADLGDSDLIDEILAGDGARKGYNFTYKLLKPHEYIVEAIPGNYRRTGVKSFYVDESGVICCGDNGGEPCGSCDPPCEPIDE